MCQSYHDLYRHHHREVLSRVVQTQELMTLVCVMFEILLDSLIGILEGDLLRRFERFATPLSAGRGSECLPSVISTFPILWNWLGT